MHCHLVTIEVSVIGCANQRMNPNRFAFNQLGLKRLDRQSMQGRGAVQEHRMAFCDLFENVPDFRRLALDHLLGAAHGVHVTKVFQPTNNKRLEKNQRHLLRQTALMQFQFRTNDDDGTA